MSGRVRGGRGVRIERVIEGALAFGLLVSSALFILGLARGASEPLKWGILLLMLTPVARVAVVTVGLALERDWTFTIVSVVVLAILASGIWVAVHR